MNEPVSDYVNIGTRDLVIKETDDIQTVTIFGLKYAIEWFRLMSTVDIGRSFKILSRKDGSATLQVIDNDARIRDLEALLRRHPIDSPNWVRDRDALLKHG